MAIFKHPAAQLGLSWRAGIVFDGDSAADTASGFTGPELDASVTNEDVKNALNAQGFDATMDKAVSAALRVSIFEGLHEMSTNWRKGVNSNGEVNGDVAVDPSTVDTSGLGHNSPASNLGEAADLFAGTGIAT